MRRVFIGGCPRSGTTLLQLILSMGNELDTFPETHYFRLGIGRGFQKIKSPYYRFKFSRGMQGTKWWHILKSENYIIKIIEKLDRQAADAGMSRWLEKTPEHIFYMNDLWKIYPDTQFVLIRRESRPTIASVVDMWRKYREQTYGFLRLKSNVIDTFYGLLAFRYGCGTLTNGIIYRAYKLWLDSELVAIENMNHNNVLLCEYSTLINSPKKTIMNICSFLSIEFKEEMLHPENNIKKIITNKETWKENNKNPISNNIIDKYDLLEKKEKHYLSKVINSCDHI